MIKNVAIYNEINNIGADNSRESDYVKSFKLKHKLLLNISNKK